MAMHCSKRLRDSTDRRASRLDRLVAAVRTIWTFRLSPAGSMVELLAMVGKLKRATEIMVPAVAYRLYGLDGVTVELVRRLMHPMAYTASRAWLRKRRMNARRGSCWTSFDASRTRSPAWTSVDKVDLEGFAGMFFDDVRHLLEVLEDKLGLDQPLDLVNLPVPSILLATVWFRRPNDILELVDRSKRFFVGLKLDLEGVCKCGGVAMVVAQNARSPLRRFETPPLHGARRGPPCRCTWRGLRSSFRRLPA